MHDDQRGAAILCFTYCVHAVGTRKPADIVLSSQFVSGRPCIEKKLYPAVDQFYAKARMDTSSLGTSQTTPDGNNNNNNRITR